jgi:hypothetical protein
MLIESTFLKLEISLVSDWLIKLLITLEQIVKLNL